MDLEFVKQGALFVPTADPFGHRPHRAAVSRWALHDLVARLPQLQFGKLRPNFWPRGVRFPDSPAHVRFACSELTRHAVLWASSCAYSATHGIQTPDYAAGLAQVVSNALWLRLEVDTPDPKQLAEGVEAYLFPTTSPQWEFMRSFAYRATQASWMFGDALTNRHKRMRERGRPFQAAALEDAFAETLGMSVASFVGCTQLLFAKSLSENPRLDAGSLYLAPEVTEAIAPWIVGSRTDRLVLDALLPKTLKLISATAPEMRKELEARASSTDVADLLRGPSPLQRHPVLLPFSNTRAFGVAPVPHLILEFLYEPLTDILFGACERQGLAGDFNLLLEEYIGLLLARHSPALLPWHHELDLAPDDGPVVDWACQFPSHVVLVDAKRAWIDPAERHRLHAGVWDGLQRTLVRGVRQGAGFWKAVRAGKVRAMSGARNKRPVLLLVTGSDTLLLPYPARLKRELLEEAHQMMPDMHVAVVGLDQFHRLLQTWQGQDIDWLPETLSRNRRTDGVDLDKLLDSEVTGPLWREVTEMLGAMQASWRPAPPSGRSA